MQTAADAVPHADEPPPGGQLLLLQASSRQLSCALPPLKLRAVQHPQSPSQQRQLLLQRAKPPRLSLAELPRARPGSAETRSRSSASQQPPPSSQTTDSYSHGACETRCEQAAGSDATPHTSCQTQQPVQTAADAVPHADELPPDGQPAPRSAARHFSCDSQPATPCTLTRPDQASWP